MEVLSFSVNYGGYSEVFFKAKPTQSVGRVMAAACEKQGLKRENYVIRLNDTVLSENKTLRENGVKDSDILYIEPYSVAKHGVYEQ
jgi:uncharacterized ubiquitin-like protein YukD